MKIAVLTDIHANFRALETVINHIDCWDPDFVVVAGDIVNRGPRSLCCLEWIEGKRQTDGWQVIKGNHEDYVIERDNPDDPKGGPIYEMFQPVHFTYNQLNKDTSPLRSLPDKINIAMGNAGEVWVHHASMLGNRDGIYPENTQSELVRKISSSSAVFITGHTHRPLIRNINDTLVVNAGSVGLPFDGDTRTSYAQVIFKKDQWQAKIIRLEYNLHLAEMDYHDYGFIDGGGPLVELILTELRTGMGQLYQWVAQYNHSIRKGEISVAEAVSEFLQSPITQPYW